MLKKANWMLVMAVPILLSPALVFGQAGDLPETPTEVNFFDFFVVKGGPIAFGLILLSIVAVALTVEHALTIRRTTTVPEGAAERIRSLIGQRRYLEAIRYTADEPSMFGQVMHASLAQAPNGYEEMERAAEEALDERSARLFRKTEYLNIIGSVSPMIGLFGTVVGMILLFAEIHAADAFPGARIVADRIAVALITTFWGLAVAIPTLSVHALFRNRIEVLAAECMLAVESVLALFKPGTAASSGLAGQSTSEMGVQFAAAAGALESQAGSAPAQGNRVESAGERSGRADATKTTVAEGARS